MAVAAAGNQVLYSTHSPALLNVVRLDELVFAERGPSVGTTLLQPEPLPADEEFRAYSEFDSSRSELFLARAVLVEGLTEKLTLPFAFEALGHDPDRERISIVECGGKGNIPLFAKVCRAVGLPFVAVHDRDAPPGEEPSEAERELNALIADAAGDDRVELAPDFEGVAGITATDGSPRGRGVASPASARRRFPEPLVGAVARAVALAERSRWVPGPGSACGGLLGAIGALAFRPRLVGQPARLRFGLLRGVGGGHGPLLQVVRAGAGSVRRALGGIGALDRFARLLGALPGHAAGSSSSSGSASAPPRAAPPTRTSKPSIAPKPAAGCASFSSVPDESFPPARRRQRRPQRRGDGVAVRGAPLADRGHRHGDELRRPPGARRSRRAARRRRRRTAPSAALCGAPDRPRGAP